MQVKSHYVKSFDNTQIYYETMGKGPAICACNGIGVSTFFWKYIARHFAPTNQIILWDYRSHGKSGRAPDYDNLTMATNARDLLSVLDHAKVKKTVILGHSMGVQTLFEFYRLFPERCAGLIPVLGTYGNPMDTFLGTDIVKYLFPIGYHTTYLFPKIVSAVTQALFKVIFCGPVPHVGARLTGFVNGQHIKRQDLEPYFEHLRSLDLRMFMGMAKRMQENSAKDILPDIKVPVLIVSGEDDLFTPWEVSDKMRRLIPDAELLTISRGSHAALIEQPELMNLRIEKFIRERLHNSDWHKPKPKRAPKKATKKAIKIKKAPAAPKKSATKAKKKPVAKATTAKKKATTKVKKSTVSKKKPVTKVKKTTAVKKKPAAKAKKTTAKKKTAKK